MAFFFMKNTDYRIQNVAYSVAHLRFAKLPCEIPTSRIPYLASRIPYHASRIPYPVSHIKHPASRITDLPFANLL
jgi:hypothetical protein